MSATWAICLTVVALSWVAMAYAAGTYLRRLREARERLHRYRVATTTAHRWLGPVHGAGETALWVAQVGEGKRGCDIEQFREGLLCLEPTGGARLIAQERNRQITEEGRTASADDEQPRDTLAWAAACYAVPAHARGTVGGLPGIGADKIADRLIQRVARLPDRNSPEGAPEAMLVTAEELRAALLDEISVREGRPMGWPGGWPSESWKPASDPDDRSQRIRELVKAGALIAAEVDREMRAMTRGWGG